MRKVLMVFLLAAVAGYGGARMWEAEGIGKNDVIPKRPAREGISGDVQAPVDPIHWARTAGPVPERDLSDWSEDQIRAALDEGVADLGAIEGRGGRFWAVVILFGSWMDRNPDAAFSWFKALRSEDMQRSLAGTLGGHWPEDRIDQGLEYLIANRELFEEHGFLWSGYKWGSLIENAVTASAGKGPEDLVRMLAFLERHRLHRGFHSNTVFPEDFDFKKLVSLPEMQPFLDRTFFAAAWVSRRPDEAFDHFVMKSLPKEHTQAADLFSDVVPQVGKADREGAKARAKWLAGKLDGMPPESRKKVVMDLMDGYKYEKEWIVGSVAFYLKDRTQGEELMGEAVRFYGTRYESVLSLLDGVEDTTLRVNQLKSTYTDRLRMETLTPVKEKLLRDQLVSWKVKSDDVEAIVARFKGGRR